MVAICLLSVLRVVSKVDPNAPGVFALAVPQVEEGTSKGCSVRRVLGPSRGDRPSQDDTVGEVRLGELLLSENHEKDECGRLETESAEVGFAVFLPVSEGVGDDREVVAIDVPVHGQQLGCQARV